MAALPSTLSRPGRKASGFTLIEMMITVAIIAVVTAVAMPSYQGYVARTQRAAATSCLTEMAQFMERVYATNLRYDLNNAVATALPNTQCRTDIAGRYTFGLATAQATFTVTAVPQGTQASADAACGTLGLTQTGAKSVSGSSTVAKCWR
jgi:type IV pilus assembly protein PilE